jgi:hypothetical protein
LRPTEILTPGNGQILPLTGALKNFLSEVDGRKTLEEIMQAVGVSDEQERASLSLALQEAFIHGAIIAQPGSA